MLAQRPNWAQAEVAYSDLLFGAGRAEEAMSAIERVLANDPAQSQALLRRGRYFLENGRIEEATADLERIIAAGQSEPNNADRLSALALLAESKISNGDPEGADDLIAELERLHRLGRLDGRDRRAGQLPLDDVRDDQ